jgi:hypothetical protein
MSTKRIIVAAIVLLLSIVMAWARQAGRSDEGGHVLALDNSWNRALETKDTKALDLLLADTFVSVDIDGSMDEASIPDWHQSPRLPTFAGGNGTEHGPGLRRFGSGGRSISQQGCRQR